MKINKKRLKKIRLKFNREKKENSYTKMDKLVNNIPYKKGSLKQITERGRKLIKPAYNYLCTKQQYFEEALNYKRAKKTDNTKVTNKVSKSQASKFDSELKEHTPVDSRTLSFDTLKRDKQNSVTLCGFVGGYRLSFNKFYHQVAIYVLLRYVSGITYNNHFEYLTDHLWIDTNLANRLLFYDTTVGIGDCVIVRGRPKKYNGHIGKIRGIKSSLDDAVIVSSGYPVIKNKHFMYRVIPYNHGRNYIYYANAGMSPNIVLGNEVSNNMKNYIHNKKYYIGYSNEYDLGVIIHEGLKFKVYKRNPRLIVTFHNYNKKIIRNVRWTTNAYSIKHGTVLTSAKNYQHHPKNTERAIDDRLKDAMTISYKYIIQNAIGKD